MAIVGNVAIRSNLKLIDDQQASKQAMMHIRMIEEGKYSLPLVNQRLLLISSRTP